MGRDHQDDFPKALTARGYQAGEVLGRGAQGSVFRAQQEALDRDVVVKVIRIEGGFGDALERARAEAQALKVLRHSNVCGLLDFQAEDEWAALVFPFQEGEPLSDLILAHGKLDAPIVTGVLQDLAAGLAAVHEAGLVHRDLKPSNVLVSKEGSAFLIDFGLVGGDGTAGVTETGVFVGTPSYASPDRLDGREATPADDVYALGVIAYECLTGSNPFSRPSLGECLQRIRTLRPSPPRRVSPEVPSWISNLVLALIVKDAARRPSASEVLEALEAREEVQERGEGTRIIEAPEARTGSLSVQPARQVARDGSLRRRGAGALGILAAILLVGWMAARTPGIGPPGSADSLPRGTRSAPARDAPLMASRIRGQVDEALRALTSRRTPGSPPGGRPREPGDPMHDPFLWAEIVSSEESLQVLLDLAGGDVPLSAPTLSELRRLDRLAVPVAPVVLAPLLMARTPGSGASPGSWFREAYLSWGGVNPRYSSGERCGQLGAVNDPPEGRGFRRRRRPRLDATSGRELDACRAGRSG